MRKNINSKESKMEEQNYNYPSDRHQCSGIGENGFKCAKAGKFGHIHGQNYYCMQHFMGEANTDSNYEQYEIPSIREKLEQWLDDINTREENEILVEFKINGKLLGPDSARRAYLIHYFNENIKPILSKNN